VWMLAVLLSTMLGYALDQKGITRLTAWIMAGIASIVLALVGGFFLAFFMPPDLVVAVELTAAQLASAYIASTVVGLVLGLILSRVAKAIK